LNGSDTELAFWFFLLDQGPEKRDWFTSLEYRIWSIGLSSSSFFPVTTLSFSAPFFQPVSLPSLACHSQLWFVVMIFSPCAHTLSYSFVSPSEADILQVDAWIFLVGSLSSSVTNVLFLFVLIRFPSFFRHVKAEGADPDVVVRLSTFYELNVRFCSADLLCNRQLTPTDSLSGLCFDLLQLSHYSSLP
jgi:hypothetical protein